MNTLVDIPRIYTALAEWCACMIYLAAMRGKKWTPLAVLTAIAALIAQIAFLTLTGGLPLPFWIPCMLLAVGIIFLVLWLLGSAALPDAAYCCVQAFVLAELAASLEWQVHCFFWPNGGIDPAGLVVLGVVYGLVFLMMGWLVGNHLPPGGRLGITWRELGSALIIAFAVFVVSNLSFVSNNTPFSGRYAVEIMNIRTLVDLGGVAILFAHLLLCSDLRMRGELEAVQNALQSQYQQYQQSRESIELINHKYHDIKHQIAALRAEPNPALREAYLEQMEADIKQYEAQNKTGNSVLDAVLTSKSLYCARRGITFTCVADGTLVDFMNAMDLCSVIGNALDNAIEYEEKVVDEEKKLIHMTLSAQKGFVLLRVENYCEEELAFEDGLPASTKGDPRFHGYGLKSIRYVARKYGGTVTVAISEGWFELKVLLPRQNTLLIKSEDLDCT